jgi:Carboxypeptidase regulatory-like domain
MQLGERRASSHARLFTHQQRETRDIMRITERTLGVVAIALALSSHAAAQGLQTGVVTGTVTSVDGLSMPGATVAAESAALQGVRTAVSDVNGNYVVRGLPPGEYTVRIEMDGMATRTERTAVALGRTTVVDAVLSPAAVSEVVTVSGTASPVVANPIVGANLRKSDVDALPMGRTPQNIAELSPGLTDNTPNAGQVTISGGFGYDNAFMVDGVDVNDNIFGTANNLYVEDAVEETQVLTSGISAEYGRFSGGVVNLVTKRGGNRFTGSYRANFSNPAWADETPFETTARRNDLQVMSEATLGGPVMRDRVWFFAAARNENTSAPFNFVDTGIPGEAGTDETRVDAKLTGTWRSRHTFQGSFLNTDLTQTGVRGIVSAAVDPRVLVTRRTPQSLAVASWQGVLSSQLFATAQYSEKRWGFRGNGNSSTAILDSPFRTRGGGGLPSGRLYNAPYLDANDPEDRNNRQLASSLSYFWSAPRLGSHDVKAGAERFTTAYRGGNSQSSTGYVFYSNYVVDAGGKPLFNADGTLTPRFVPGTSMLYNWLPTRGATMDIHTTSLYLQDRWAANRHVSFDLGMRYERVRNDSTGDVVSANTEAWLPRLAATYDVSGNGKWVAQATYGHYAGRYSEAQFTANSNVANPSLVISVYTGPAGEGLGFAPGLNPSNYTIPVLGSFPTQNVSFEDGLSSPLSREMTASFGGEIGTKGYVKGTYVRRRTSNVIDDFINRELGSTTISRNGATIGTYDNVQFRNVDDALYREYQALAFQSRYAVSRALSVSGHWTLQLRNHGNFEGEVANRPGAPSPFGDYPGAFSAERHYPEGRLDDFQQHKVRVWTTYLADMGRFGSFDLTALYRYNSGLTYSLRANGEALSAVQRSAAQVAGYSGLPGGGVQTLFFGERGSESFDGAGVVDFNVGYNVPVFKSLRPYVKLELLNAFNNQSLTSFDTTVSGNWNGPLDAMGLPTTYTRGPRFGQATRNADFPAWRTGQTGGRAFLVAAGFRF